jgi:chorismate synthase
MNKVRFLTSGESHGKGLLGIIDGIPAGVTIDETYINSQLKRRQGGAGRSNRMKIESDIVEIYGGVRKGKTIGAPIGMIINNVDCREVEKVTVPRPGHADLAGINKFWFDDIRDVSERASARETAMRVALCSVCMKVLEDIRIDISSKVDERYVMEAKSKKDTVGGLFEITVENLPYGLGSYTHWDKKINAELILKLINQ